MTKTDRSWEKLFDKYAIMDKINKDGFYEITAKQINEHREARLMTKFDHRNNLPKLFKQYNLAILPITRGSYIISQFDAYKILPYDSHTEKIEVPFPSHLESIDFNNIYSESVALNCAYSTCMINHFIGEETLPTVSGRMSSSSFNFNIRNSISGKGFPVEVKNSQIEIDGGYEGESKLMLLEVKNSVPHDFLIRQLYYPYRLWEGKITKKVVPVFMTYSNDIFSFFRYEFDNPLDYNSLYLVEQKHYIIAPEKITLTDIIDLLSKTKIIPEPEVSYPQANSFERVINLLEMLTQEDLTRDDVTHTFDVEPRQTNYYTSAGMYLGLVGKKKGTPVTYTLTDEGKRIMGLPHKQKNLQIAQKIIRNPSFNKVLRIYLDKARSPEIVEIVEIMKSCNVYGVGKESTFFRRASTVIRWIEWVLGLCKY